MLVLVLARYQIVRGRRSQSAPLPEGMREDTRKHTRHVLRPPEALVAAFLADVDHGWEAFRRGYLDALEERYATDRGPFEELAERASKANVFLGCNCPTKHQPDVGRCHTVLALGFMKERFPELEIALPPESLHT
jgi:uncharacterized protein YeaO (DUF488 family)